MGEYPLDPGLRAGLLNAPAAVRNTCRAKRKMPCGCADRRAFQREEIEYQAFPP